MTTPYPQPGPYNNPYAQPGGYPGYPAPGGYDPAVGYSGYGPPPTPTAVKTLGIIGIILGALALLNHVGGLLLHFFTEMTQDQPEDVRRFDILSSSVSLVFALALLVASIGVLLKKPWARKLLMGWAAGYLPWLVISLGLSLAIVIPAMLERMPLAGGPPEQEKAKRIGAYGGPVCVGIVLAVYPICVLVYMRRADIRAAFGDTSALANLPQPGAWPGAMPQQAYYQNPPGGPPPQQYPPPQPPPGASDPRWPPPPSSTP